MEFSENDVMQIAQIIWEATLGLTINTDCSPAMGNRPQTTGAWIQITGDWNGVVMLDCPAEVARMAASTMFGMPPAAVGPSELQDAVAEIVNMIAGNFKALLQGAASRHLLPLSSRRPARPRFFRPRRRL
jgi:CheY-specific phosphatase CheX